MSINKSILKIILEIMIVGIYCKGKIKSAKQNSNNWGNENSKLRKTYGVKPKCDLKG